MIYSIRMYENQYENREAINETLNDPTTQISHFLNISSY